MLLLILATLALKNAVADQILPYGTRTRAYSGYTTTARGDNETIGMANATVAVPGSISSLESNPAGLTMTMGSVSAQINSSEIQDREVTGADQKKIRNSQWGLAVVPGDWGYAISYYTPSFEGGSYTSPNTSNTREYEVSLKQLRFSVSKSMMDKKLSVGASLEFNHAIRDIGTDSYGASDISYKLGAIYHVRRHFLVGMSYSPPQDVGDSLPHSGGAELPGFAQPIRSPSILTIGTGWMPNRFFTSGLAVAIVGTTKDTSLFRDQSYTVGENLTFQPRVGASYTLAEYSFVKVSTAAGLYYETPRAADTPKRLHGTFAFQVNPWFLNIGFGVDRAERYNNITFSIGVDAVRLARTLKMIPRDPVPPLGGFWPEPTTISADGLPDPLTVGEEKKYSGPSVGDVGTILREIPGNISNTLHGEPTESELREQRELKARQTVPKKRKPRKRQNPN